MHRRRVLKLGAALAAIPLSGCGPATPEPRPTGAPGPTASAGTPPPGPPSATPTVTPAPTAEPTASASAEPAPTSTPAEPPKPETPAFSRVVGKVGRNHGHVLTVAFEDVKAGAEKSYTITGTSSHPHTVTLTADHMKSLLKGEIVRMKSSRDSSHAHRVLVRCAPAVDPPEWTTACDATFSGQDEHELVVPAADIAARVDKTYDVQGIAGHRHDLTITAEGFKKLEKGEALSIQTSRLEEDAHLHTVFIQFVKRSKT